MPKFTRNSSVALSWTQDGACHAVRLRRTGGDACRIAATWSGKADKDHPLVQAAVKDYETLFGKEPVVDKWTFSTNLVATTGRHKIPAIGFGPGDEEQAHAPNEITRVKDLEICSAFYAELPYLLEK